MKQDSIGYFSQSKVVNYIEVKITNFINFKMHMSFVHIFIWGI